MRYWSRRIIRVDPKRDKGNSSQSRWRSPTHSCPWSVKRDLRAALCLSAICVDARAELNLSKRLSACSDSKGSLSLKKILSALAFCFKSNFSSVVCARCRSRFVLFGWRSTCSTVFLFLKYIAFVLGCRKHLERLKFATCSWRLLFVILLHLKSEWAASRLNLTQHCEGEANGVGNYFFVCEIIAAKP